MSVIDVEIKEAHGYIGTYFIFHINWMSIEVQDQFFNEQKKNQESRIIINVRACIQISSTNIFK